MKVLKKLFLVITFLACIILLIGCANSEYEGAFEFNDGLASVKLNGLYGFIDSEGNLVIEPTYDEGGHFSNGIALVRKNGLYGGIDKNNNTVIPFEYSAAILFSKDLISVEKDGFYGAIDKNNNIIIPFEYSEPLLSLESENLISVKKNDKYGCINLKGEIIIDFIYNQPIEIYSASGKDKIAIITENNLQGIIDLDTGFKVEPTYTQVSPWFGDDDKNIICIEQRGKYGFINLDTKKIIEPKYSDTLVFQEGLASLNIDNKFGSIDVNGKIVIPPIYDYPYYFSNGLASVSLNGKSGYINKQNEIVAPLIYDSADTFYSCNIATVTINGKVGLINTKGELICEPKFESLSLDSDSDMFPACYKNEQGEINNVYVNRSGEIIFNTTYTEISPFYNGVAQVSKDGKYGYIAIDGMEIIPPIYDEAQQFGDTFLVKLNGKWGVVDKKHRSILKCEYDSVGSDMNAIKNDIYLLSKDSKWGIYNASTNKFTDLLYDEIKINSELTYPCAVRIEDKWFYIDEDGNKL